MMARGKYSTDELFNVFLQWINLFDFSAYPIKNVYELSDGIIIFKLLSKLSPHYFSLKSINTSPHDAYTKNNNIIELKQCLEQFFNDVIDQDIAIDKMIDHNRITSNSYSNNDNIRIQHFVRLIEMVLLCSIKCKNKQETIGKMTSLTMEDQGTLMNILQTLMTNTGFEIKDDHKHDNTNTQNKKISEKESLKPVDTPQNFRRLSVASYSSECRNKSLFSPFGSKRKSRKMVESDHDALCYDYTKNDDVKTTLNFQHELNLKKDNIKLYEKNRKIIKDMDALRTEKSEISTKYLKLREGTHSKQSEFEKEMVNKYKKTEKDLKLEIETNASNIRKYKEEIRYKNDEINEYKKALIELQQENDKYSDQLQVTNDVNDRKFRELRDELDITQHQSDKAYTLEKQMKQYKLRLESLNDVQNELQKYKKLYQEKCDDVAELNEKINVIPSLKQQMEKYKKQMIEYKVASIGAGSRMNDDQMMNKMTDLENVMMTMGQENEELQLKLKTSRKEIINLEAQIADESNQYLMNDHYGGLMGAITPEMQSDVATLEAENKRLRSAVDNKQSMNDLMDELDTKTRLLQSTEAKYEETVKTLSEVTEEVENMKRTTAEWMRNSCSPQQYETTLQRLKHLENNVNDKNKYIDQLKSDIDELRESKLTSTSKIKEYEGELNRTKQRYRDLYEYTEQQKTRLEEYKKAISQMQSYESNQKQTNFETQRYFAENKQLKEKIRIINQEMGCVQNACMNLLKRQVLMNNNMLSKPKQANGNDNKTATVTRHKLNEFNTLQQQKKQNVFINVRPQIQRPTSFSFRK